MKKVILCLLVLLLVGAAYFFGGLNASKIISVPPANWTEDSQAGEAWRELLVSMEAAGAEVFSSTDNTRERLDGLLFLTHLLSASLEMKLSKGDHAQPRFTDWMGTYRKFLGDSPDATYHTAEISSKYSYEVSGNIGDAEYLGFMLYGKAFNGWNKAAANVSQESITFDEEGNFTIILSNEKPSSNDVDWLQMGDDIHMIMVRQYFHDRVNSREASLHIRNLNPDEPGFSSDPEVAAALQKSTTFFNETLNGAIALASMMSARPNNPEPPKSYNQDFAGIFYPTFDNKYLGGWFQLEEDEALVIEGEVPDAPYWSVSLQNRWMQSLDYLHYQTALNDHQIKTRNGRYRIVISSRKPDAENWLDTSDYREGILAIRHQMSASELTTPTLTLMKFDQLQAL